MSALEEFSTEDREAYVKRACSGDPELEAEVNALFDVAAKMGGFMDRPAGKLADLKMPAEKSDFRQTIEKLGTKVGKYKLVQKIGSGGFGVVYMAEQLQPVKRRVAFKIIKLGMDTNEVIARFEAERQALAMMDHPNIAKIFDAGATETGRPYFVMELVRGIPITRFCDECSSTVRERLELFLDVCRAVQHAHQKGVIHRDLKPSNVMITMHDGRPVPKVIDFGVAKATQTPLTEKTLLTRFEMFIGTPAYMSPEQSQLSGLDVDTRSDIYSLGVLLYELLTGRTPFDSPELRDANYEEFRRRIREEEPPKLSTRISTMNEGDLTDLARLYRTDPQRLLTSIRGDLDWIVMKAMEKNRMRRYETANALALDLLRHLNDEPVLARPPSVAYRFSKFARKYRAAMMFAMALSVITLLFIVGIFLQWRIAVRNAAMAEKKSREAEASERLALAMTKEVEKALTASRLNEGKAWLESARYYSDRPGEEFYAALMAGRAIGYEQCGRESQNNDFLDAYPVLIGQNHPEYHEARLLIANYGNAPRPVWRTPVTRHHEDGVLCVAFSPDGATMASGGEDNKIVIWDAASGMKIRTLSGHRLNVRAVAFSADSRMLASGSDDTTIILWDVSSGKKVTTLNYHEGAVNSVAFSPVGSVLASGSEDRSVVLWDTQSKEAPERLLRHTGDVRSVAFSIDGSTLASGSADESILLWDLGKVNSDPRALIGHTEPVNSVAFSPDGVTLASGGRDRIVAIWQWRAEAEPRFLRGHDWSVNGVAFSPDGKILVSGGGEGDWGSIILTDVVDGEVLVKEDNRHFERIMGVACHPDGKMVATASTDMTVQYWGIESHEDAQPVAASHRLRVKSVAISHDGKTVATGGDDGRVILWDLRSGEKLWERPPLGRYVYDVAFSPDDRTIAFSVGEKLRLWDVETGTEKIVLEESGFGGNRLAYSPDGKFLAFAGDTECILVWNLETGERFQSAYVEKHDFRSLAFGPSGKMLASGGKDGKVIVWRVESTEEPTGRTVLEIVNQPAFQGHGHWVISLAFSPDGESLVSGCADGTMARWDLKSGQRLCRFVGHLASVESIVFSPNGDHLASVSGDHSIKFWELETGEELRHLPGHSDRLLSAAFSPDGKSLICGGFDRTIAVHNLSEEPMTLTGHQSYVQTVAYSPDGKTLASAGDDHQIILWDLDSGLRQQVILGHEERIWSLAFSPSGGILASASDDQSIILWDLETGGVRRKLVGHQGGVMKIAFNRGGSQLASGSKDNKVIVWDTETGHAEHRLSGHEGWVRSVAFGNNGMLASGSEDKTIRIWNSRDGSLIDTLKGHKDWVASVAFSPDGETLATSSYDKTVKVWDLNRNVARTIWQDWVLGLSFSPDGKTLAGVRSNGVVRLWETDTLGVLKTYTGHGGSVETVAFSPDGATLATGSRDRTIKLWPLETHAVQLADYLGDGWLDMDGRQIRWPSTASNLREQRTFKHLSPPASTHIGILGSARSSDEIDKALFWSYFRARNWKSVLTMLPLLRTPQERFEASQALLQWMDETIAAGHLAKEVAEFRIGQLAELDTIANDSASLEKLKQYRDELTNGPSESPTTHHKTESPFNLAGRWQRSVGDQFKIEQNGSHVTVIPISPRVPFEKATGKVEGATITLENTGSRESYSLMIEPGKPMTIRSEDSYWRMLRPE